MHEICLQYRRLTMHVFKYKSVQMSIKCEVKLKGSCKISFFLKTVLRIDNAYQYNIQ